MKNLLNHLTQMLCYVCYEYNASTGEQDIVGLYTSIEDAADDTGESQADILDCLLNLNEEHKSNKPYWQQEYHFVPKHLFTEKKKRGTHKHMKSAVAVVQIDMRTNAEVARYHSIYEATKCTSIDNIMNCCKGKAKSAGGYKWMLAPEYDELYKLN